MAAFNKMIDVTFPEEHFDEAKRKVRTAAQSMASSDSPVAQLVDISAEFESPTKVIKLLAEKREDEFRRAVLELAARMERTLPTLKVEVEEPLAAADGDEDDERDERAEDEVTFTAADLREAFNGTLAEWEELVKQADPEVRAFVTRRAKGQHTPDASAEKKKQMTPVKPAPVASKAAPPPLPTSSTSSSAAPLAKKMLPPPPPLPTAAVAAAKRKTSEPAAKPEKKAAAKAAPASPVSGGSDGKRRRRFWAHEEELDLVRGVRKYGKGSWKKILQDETLSFSERSATDLKDKWRNLEKKKEEYEKELDEQSEGEEGGRPKARGGKGVKRQAEEMEEDDDERGKQDEHEPIEDSDVEKEKPVEVKREQAAAKKQAVSPNQIRESALEARNKRLQLLSNSNE